VGRNGCGKSSLLRLLVGDEKPTRGEITRGSTVSLGLVSQSRDSLRNDRTVIEELSDGADEVVFGDKRLPIRQFAAAFALRGAAQTKPVGVLSGGERNRVHLAKVSLSPPLRFTHPIRPLVCRS
jgi:ATPase subunit of ABC transporter with duplicated ATPase domains